MILSIFVSLILRTNRLITEVTHFLIMSFRSDTHCNNEGFLQMSPPSGMITAGDIRKEMFINIFTWFPVRLYYTCVHALSVEVVSLCILQQYHVFIIYICVPIC